MKPVFSAEVLGKYQVTYYYSEKSGILQTEEPYWLDEAYSEAIAKTDTGLVQRNISMQRKLEPILYLLFSGEGKFLDIGGGYGLLARLMRDRGYNCYTLDKYAENIFARGFEPDEGFKADGLFAFEVFEHIPDPVAFLNEHFSKWESRTIIFSTLTFQGDIPERDWWYYSFETGQHITFYQPKTLELLAKKFACSYYMLNPSLHIITDRTLTRFDRFVLGNRYLFKLLEYWVRLARRGKSKTWEDHKKIKDMVMSEEDKVSDQIS